MKRVLGAAIAALTLGWASAASAATIITADDPTFGAFFSDDGAYFTILTDADFDTIGFNATVEVNWGVESDDGLVRYGDRYFNTFSELGLMEPKARRFAQGLVFYWPLVPKSTHVHYDGCIQGSCGYSEHFGYRPSVFVEITFTLDSVGKSYTLVRGIDPSIDWSTVPEPTTWALMIVGFGLVGAAARRARLVAFR